MYNPENKISEADVVIPEAVYQFNVQDAVFGNSKKTNAPMVTWTLELMNAPKLKVVLEDESVEMVDPNGMIFNSWSVLASDTPMKTKTCLEHFNKILRTLELPEIDENMAPPVEQLKGKAIWAIASTVNVVKKDAEGNVLINPYDNTPIMDKQRKINRILTK